MLQSFFNKFTKKLPRKRLKDPVCGMEATDEISFDYKGQTYSFCSGHCQEQFRAQPEHFVAK